MATLTPMHEGDDEVETDGEDAELDQLGADLETVEAALTALDADDLDEAEKLASSLAEPTPAVDD